MKKSEIISKAIGRLDEEMIIKADEKKTKKTSRGAFRKSTAIRLIAAGVCAVLAAGAVFIAVRGTSSIAIAEAVYPKAAKYPGEHASDKAYEAWTEQKLKRYSCGADIGDSADSFYKSSAAAFLTDCDGENLVYSPVNVYMALAMLAETTDGSSRRQILGLLGADSIEQLRGLANNMWHANYRNDGATVSIPANSLWLSDGISYKNGAVKTLADEYFASVYRGDLGSEKMTKAVRKWLNEQTGGRLKDAVNNVGFDDETLLALFSTLYFRAKWDLKFSADDNDVKTFHAPDGDIRTEFMNNSDWTSTFYADEDFSAINLPFADNGCMWLILPDEDKSVSEVLNAGRYLDMMRKPEEWESQKSMRVNYSVPKFDVSSQYSLIKGLRALGVTDVFSSISSDFSPLTYAPVYMNEAKHAARVTIDEEGCTAVAFTEMLLAGAAPPSDDETDFIVDRPFIFAIMSDARQPLFIGTVNDPRN